MKYTLLSFAACFTWLCATSQTPMCNENRFKSAVFQDVEVTKDVQFGSAKQLIDVVGPNLSPDLQGQGLTPVLINQKLFFDLYQPAGDVMQNRPLIIMAFGGAFVFGTKSDDYMVDLCTRYAQLGYVVASIDYRLTRELALAATKLDEGVAPKAVLKGTHDMKAAVRFFRASANADNPYRIDPSQIYVGGLSAGAFCATHAAYLDKLEEIPQEILEYAIENGGVEGNSGTPGVSSAVAGVISLSGALGEATWMEKGDVPIVSTHGTADEVVPYGSDSVTILGINYPVDGSSTVHQRANEIGVPNAFYTYIGASHAPESGSEAYRDTGFAFTRDFMYEVVCNNIANTINDNKVADNWTLYPNPAQDIIYLSGVDAPVDIAVYNVSGQLIFESKGVAENTIDVANFKNGLYYLHMYAAGKTFSKSFLKE